MMNPSPIASLQVEVNDPLGLHLRPTTRFVELARRYAADIRVRHDSAVVDGKSVMDLLCLAAGPGTTLDLEASGHDAEEAVAALAALFSSQPQEAKFEESRVGSAMLRRNEAASSSTNPA